MHGRNILLIVTLALPIIAVPISFGQVDTQVETATQRRDEFPVADVLRDIRKREPIIEAVAKISMSRVTSSGDKREEADNEDDVELEKRAGRRIPDGGHSKVKREGRRIPDDGHSKAKRAGRRIPDNGHP